MLDHSKEVSTPSPIPAIRTPLELLDAFEEACHAHRALSALIGTARLAQFDSGECYAGTPAIQIASNLQWGLSKLMDMCVDSQSRIINSYAARYQNSDENLLRKVKATLEQVKAGCFRGDKLKMELTAAMGITQVVVQRGDMLASHARELEPVIEGMLKASGREKQALQLKQTGNARGCQHGQ